MWFMLLCPEKRRALRSPGQGPYSKRGRTEEAILKRLENLDRRNAANKENESARFGSVVADMLEKVPDTTKEEVKFKIYQLLYGAMQPDNQ